VVSRLSKQLHFLVKENKIKRDKKEKNRGGDKKSVILKGDRVRQASHHKMSLATSATAKMIAQLWPRFPIGLRLEITVG